MENRYMTELDILGTNLSVEDAARRKRKPVLSSAILTLESLDELLKKDKSREKDGFPPKIKFRRALAGPDRIISVPYVEEEKLIHGEFEPHQQSGKEMQDGDLGENMPGSGGGEVGDVIGEVPIRGGEGEGEDPTAGKEPGEHGIEEEAYQKGKELAEKFQLPNLKDRGKKVPTDEYTYDLTDRHTASGQVLDKKETLKSIVKTNSALGRLDRDSIDTSKLVVSPKDKIYRVLSREKVWKSQAIAFFARDYSGSMWGDPTKVIVEQHLMIYSWLLVQYDKLVIPRFFIHDTEAKEVTVQEYFSLSASGGTFIPSVYKEITKTVESESLARDFNIYVWQGTDGEDGDDGREAIPELEKILNYVNRMGVTILKHPYYGDRETPFEQYVKKSNILAKRSLLRMHVMSSQGVTEDQNIIAIRALIAQD